MRKYKLIKEYPGLPSNCKINSIIQSMNPVNGAYDGWFDVNWCKTDVLSFKFGNDLHPENYPEFWMELKVLFITEDEVDIYQGDIIYSVSKNFSLHKNVAGSTVFETSTKLFSSETAANNYLDKAKRFSKQEVLSLVNELKNIHSDIWDDLIKQRMRPC